MKTLPEKERLQKYTAKDYFLPTRWIENQSWHKKTLRTDQLAVLAYSLGYSNYAQMCKRLARLGIKRDEPKKLVGSYKQLISGLEKGKTRNPQMVIDIGCGRGELLLAYHMLGIECVGIDPSPGAETLIPQTMRWENVYHWSFINKGMLEGLKEIEFADTIVMCESIEHVRENEFGHGWGLVCNLLRESQGLFIVANWVNYHPIPIDSTGYDHIRRIDNPFFDRLSKDAKKVVFRKGSHLVLQF